MIPLVIFMAVAIIGILVYFLIIKKKSNKNIINKLEKKCNENEVNINGFCKKVLNELDCKSSSPYFMKLDARFNNTSCTEMATYEKMEYCKKIKKVLFNKECKIVMSNKDCEKIDEFTKPDSTTMNTTCVSKSENEKIEYCKSKNKVFSNNSCIDSKKETDCPTTKYMKLDPKTNNTTCTKMSNEEIKDLCKNLKKIYKGGQCIDPLTEDVCSNKYNNDEPLFNKKLSADKSKCVELSDSEKLKICSNYGMIYNGVKCVCPKNTILFNGQCLGAKSDEQCHNEFKFTKPNKSTGNSSCIQMTNKEKENYCQSKNMIYHKNDCRKVLTNLDCQKEIVEDKLFKKVPDEENKNTSCRELNLIEKEKICKDNNRVWLNDKCLEKLKKPKISILEENPYDVTLNVKIKEDLNLNKIKINHQIDDPCECKDNWWANGKDRKGCVDADNNNNPWCYVKGNIKCGISNKSINQDKSWRRCKINENNYKKDVDVKITNIDNKNKNLEVKISKLSNKSQYNLKLKLLTDVNKYEFPISDNVVLKTSCDNNIYTRSYCRNNMGPENTFDSTVKNSRKEKNVNSWPFFKVPDIINGKACGCRELKESEAKQLCINTYYPHFKNTNRKVFFKDNKCVPAPIAVGPPLNYNIQNLSINQDIDSNNNLINILNEKNYRLDSPFRIKLEWNRPDLNEFESDESVIPLKYNIFRKELLSGKNFLLIKVFETTKDKTNFIFIDGDTKKNYNLSENILKPNTVYEYKIIPINSIGEGPHVELSIKTKEKRLSKEYCESEDNREDPDEDIDFDGFLMNYDSLNNKCKSKSVLERNNICKNLKQIELGYDNIYNAKSKKCVPLTMNLKLPGKPKLVLIQKTSNMLNFSIVPPKEFGIPVLTDYILKWKNMETNETGRLTHGDNYGQINIAGIESYSNPVYVKPDSNGVDLGINIIHNNLNPATTYQYTIEAVSFNDNLWNNYKGDLNTGMEDNRIVGVSELFSIEFTTFFSVPLECPNLNINETKHNSVTILIDKFPEGKEGGIYKSGVSKCLSRDGLRLTSFLTSECKQKCEKCGYGSKCPTGTKWKRGEGSGNKCSIIKESTNTAALMKYKIKRILLPKGKNLSSFFKSSLEGVEFEIELDKLSEFNSNSNELSISYDESTGRYIFKDNTIEPISNYRYYIYAMNNKVNNWSKSFKYIDVKTSDYPPFYECKNPENLIIDQEISSKYVNKVKFNIKWDSSINPNIERYKRFGIFRITEGYPKYDLILKSDISRKEFQDITDNFLIIDNLDIDTNYSLKLKVRHRGILNFSNGFKYLVETTNETNSEDVIHLINKDEINVKKPLLKKIKTIEFKSDNDCKHNDLYFDTDIFSDGRKIYYYLDNSYPRKCVSMKGKLLKLTEYCKKNVDKDSVYWSDDLKCKVPKNGEWIKEPVQNSKCTIDGNDGKIIACGGGKKIINKYSYKPPEIDIKYEFLNSKLNGKDTPIPDGFIEKVINNKRVAFEYADCGNNSCKNLCKSKYGELQDDAYFNGKELPLSIAELNDLTYCKKDVKQPVTLNLPSETCPSCGNPEDEQISKTWTCLDGFAGRSEIIKCKEQTTSNINDDLNIKNNLIEEVTKKDDRVEGKWYKCHGLVDTKGNVIPHDEYKNVSYCNPPYILQPSEKKDENGKNLMIKREKYFMQKTNKCNFIPYCNYQKTKDRFPEFTNYCGEQEKSVNKVCIGPDGNSTTFDKCGEYNNSGDWKLTKVNSLTPCQELCEGPPLNNKNLTLEGYDKWESIADIYSGKTKREFKRLCKARTLVKPKIYTKNVPGRDCGGCGVKGKSKEIYHVCEDGMYGPNEKIKCELAPETKELYNKLNWQTIENKIVDCDSNGRNCKVKRIHYSKYYSSKCDDNELNDLCDWKKEGIESKCSAYCNGGTKTQNISCVNKDGNKTSKLDCGKRPVNMWESTICNVEKCSDLCTKNGNSWVGSENKPYSEEEFNKFCEKVDAIPRVLFLDERSCDNDMKGCGLLELNKTSFCIDGIGDGQKSCKDYIDNDKSGRTWIKKVNKTNKYYDSNKDCYNGSDYFKENFEECHDIVDESTWDIVPNKRNQYYSKENIDCSEAGQGFGFGNKQYCTWAVATENDQGDCQGTVFRTYKCVDDNGKTVSSKRCPPEKPSEKVNLNLTCNLEPGKWINNSGERDYDIESACNVCGVAQSQLVFRKNKCVRSDGKQIANYNCKGELSEVKTCNKTKNCMCTCKNGFGLKVNECNAKFGFTKYDETDFIEYCKSCNRKYKLSNTNKKYNRNTKFIPFVKIENQVEKNNCPIKKIETTGTADITYNDYYYRKKYKKRPPYYYKKGIKATNYNEEWIKSYIDKKDASGNYINNNVDAIYHNSTRVNYKPTDCEKGRRYVRGYFIGRRGVPPKWVDVKKNCIKVYQTYTSKSIFKISDCELKYNYDELNTNLSELRKNNPKKKSNSDFYSKYGNYVYLVTKSIIPEGTKICKLDDTESSTQNPTK